MGDLECAARAAPGMGCAEGRPSRAMVLGDFVGSMVIVEVLAALVVVILWPRRPS